MEKMIKINTTVRAPMEKVWDYWNKPEHITHWAFASDDWEAPEAENDLREGGKFKTVMAAKDGSAKFDMTGTYTQVKEHSLIEFTMDDGRKVKVEFNQTPSGVDINESFEPENENPEEKQREGWQSILNNFKKYVESSN